MDFLAELLECPPERINLSCFEKLIQTSDTGGNSAGLDESRGNAIFKQL
jgi:hypothetical protein